ncbi:MAG: hypothetical protein IJ174_08735, partial [Clostridia bacterium]|nr:hypothetical protein [Clostridia bacterium]
YLAVIASGFVLPVCQALLLFLCALFMGMPIVFPPLALIAAVLLMAFAHACMACAAACLLPSAALRRAYSLLILALSLACSGAVVYEGLLSPTAANIWHWLPYGAEKSLLTALDAQQAAFLDWLRPGIYWLLSYILSLFFFPRFAKSARKQL